MPDSPFPPSFADNPLSYGFALFSLTTICAVALSMLLQFLFEWRVKVTLSRSTLSVTREKVPFATPLGIHRAIITCLLLTILCGALPDTLVLFFWGEATEQTMRLLFSIDRTGDALTLAPFLSAAFLSAWGMQAIPQALIREARVQLRRPGWEMVKDKVKIAALVLAISIGVTFAKAGA